MQQPLCNMRCAVALCPLHTEKMPAANSTWLAYLLYRYAGALARPPATATSAPTVAWRHDGTHGMLHDAFVCTARRSVYARAR